MPHLSSSPPQRLRPDWDRPMPGRLHPEDPRYGAAVAAHEAATEAGDGGYFDPATGLFVMTASSLAARPCCGNHCRHCPWQQ